MNIYIGITLYLLGLWAAWKICRVADTNEKFEDEPKGSIVWNDQIYRRLSDGKCQKNK